MVKRLRIGEKEYELEKDMSCEEVKGLSEFLYVDNLKEEIEQLKQENKQLRQDLKSLETTSNATSDYNAHLEGKIITLENKNEQLRQFINKGRRLSVKELMNNASENVKLKKENKKLRKELNDCEKFRYQVFKRIGELSDE